MSLRYSSGGFKDVSRRYTGYTTVNPTLHSFIYTVSSMSSIKIFPNRFIKSNQNFSTGPEILMENLKRCNSADNWFIVVDQSWPISNSSEQLTETIFYFYFYYFFLKECNMYNIQWMITHNKMYTLDISLLLLFEQNVRMCNIQNYVRQVWRRASILLKFILSDETKILHQIRKESQNRKETIRWRAVLIIFYFS